MSQSLPTLGGGGRAHVPGKNLDILELPKTWHADLQQACESFASIRSQSQNVTKFTKVHKETCKSVWPPNTSLCASSCAHLRLLAGLFCQGLKKQRMLTGYLTHNAVLT